MRHSHRNFIVFLISTVLVSNAIPAEDTQYKGYVIGIDKLRTKSKNLLNEIKEAIKEEEIIEQSKIKEEKALEYYEKAKLLEKEERYKEAIEPIEEALKIVEDPSIKEYTKKSTSKLKKYKIELMKKERKRIKTQKEIKRKSLLEAQKRTQSEIRAKKEAERIQRLEVERKKKEIKKKESELLRIKRKKAEESYEKAKRLYKEAQTLYKQGKHSEAEKKLKEMEAISIEP